MKAIGYENNNRISTKENYVGRSEDFELHEQLKSLLDGLLIERPLWTFQLEQPWHSLCVHINVHQDGEFLGAVMWKTHGVQYKYFVTNTRISDALQRKTGYFTKDLDKALRKVKKTFFRMSTTERVDKAVTDVGSAIGEIESAKSRRAYEHTRAIEKSSIRYVRETAWQEFVNHAKAVDPDVYDTIQKRDELQGEVNHIRELKNSFDKGESLLVVRENSVYIVKQFGSIETYTDNNLPHHMRSKLGMLKLVDNNTFLTSCGFRRDNKTFVLTQEKPNDQHN